MVAEKHGLRRSPPTIVRFSVGGPSEADAIATVKPTAYAIGYEFVTSPTSLLSYILYRLSMLTSVIIGSNVGLHPFAIFFSTF